MAAKKKAGRVTAEEKAAMKEYVQELHGAGEGEAEVLAKIATFKEPDRAMAKRLHAIIKRVAPGLSPKTWYGMPAYAKGDKTVCHFQGAAKFKTRYATLGFSDKANLDDGDIWPVAFALREITPKVEKEIETLLKRALGQT